MSPTMKPIIAGCLILGATTFKAGAPLVNMRSYEELDKTSDIIVIAQPVSTKVTVEKTTLPRAQNIPAVELSTEFKIIVVLKGDPSLEKLTVHHYRLANARDLLMISAPEVASSDPRKPTHYLLFLQREPDGRYAPFDQVDPALTSMLAVGTEWDKMTPDSFKTWMDAKRWLRESPNLVGSGVSTEVTSEGRAEGSLHEAAMNGKLEKARALLNANPDLVFSHASYGDLTPLQFAAQYGHKDVAELLLANKADVEAKSHGGWTPLLNAVFGGHKDLVELLLTKKANVNYQEEAGRSALHFAAQNGYTEIAALLLANNADVNAKCRDGYAPLHAAAVRGVKDVVDLLVTNKAEYTIQDAAAIGDLEKVKAMLKGNPDLVFSRDFVGSTTLHWAVGQNRKDMVELLLANNADVNAKAEKSGWTPLHMAVLLGHKDMVELLLAGRADVNAKSKDETPLHFAQSLMRKDLSDLLRQHGGHE